MDISIKWKLFASFSFSMLMPFLAIWAGVPASISILGGILTILLLTWYSYYRILNALSTIKENLKPLYEIEKNVSLSDMQDELAAAMEWSDRLMESVEASITRFDHHRQPEKSFQSGENFVCNGRLSSGDSMVGEILNFSPPGESGYQIPTFDPTHNQEIFLNGIQALKEKLAKLREVVVHENAKGIVDFQVYFLDDPNFRQGFMAQNEKGMGLESSLEALFQEFVSRLERVKNEMIRARSKDLLDLKSQLLHEIAMAISNDEENDHRLKDKILLVDNLMPSHVLRYRRIGVAGLISREGTPSSHAQILLESLGISSICEISIPEDTLDGERVALDCVNKKVIFSPSEEEIGRIHKEVEDLRKQTIVNDSISMMSGEPIGVKANLNMPHDAKKVIKYGGDGVGLFRSEIAYLGMSRLPSEEELYESYRDMVKTLEGLPVTFRMLDIGGDKLVGLGANSEENPCMGNRSMRLLNSNLELFRSQYRAMRRAAHEDTSIIFPMVNGIDEMDLIMERVEMFDRELDLEGCQRAEVKFGIMVEVPSVVECFEDMVERFDRFNIGTNDLTQYTLAADRNNQDVSCYYSTYHPAVIRMIERICRIGNDAKKSICLCGEVASDLEATALWLGLGVRELSVPYRYVPALKQKIQSLDLDACRALAEKACRQNSAKKVRDLVRASSKLTVMTSEADL